MLKRIEGTVGGAASPKGSVARRIASATVTIGTLSMIVKVASLGSTLVIASFFGTGDALEAFLVAFLLPSLIISVVSGSLSSAMVPVYLRVSERQGRDAAQALFSRVTFVAVGLLAIVAALCAMLSPYLLPLLGSGFSSGKLSLGRDLLYLLLPVTVIKGLSTIYASMLNAGERFSLAAVGPVAVPIATVLVTLLWNAPSTRIFAVAVGTIVGMLAELFLLGWGLKRAGHPLLPRWAATSAESRQVTAQWLPMVAGATLMSGAAFVDQAMAASLPSGSVASLNYGGRLVSVVLYIGAGAIATAVLPYSCRLVEAEHWGQLRSVLRVYSTRILAVTAGLSVLLFVISAPLIGFGLERGTFSKADTLLVGKIQAVYGLQIPFYVCGMMFVRVASSMRANHVLMIGSLLNLVINVLLNYVFMRRWGVVGIALSTAAVYAFSCGYLMTMVYRRMPPR